jgi:hypothetical protein
LKSRECKVCVGGQNPFKDRRSEELTLFTSVDEVPEVDSLGNKGLEPLKEDKSSKEERYHKLKRKNDCDRQITGRRSKTIKLEEVHEAYHFVYEGERLLRLKLDIFGVWRPRIEFRPFD